MIKDIFIINKYGKVLYGNKSKYPPLSLMYPIDEYQGNKLCQLKVNDCILAVLYQDIDNFMISKMLLNIKNVLQFNGLEISEKFILSNYFLFIKLLYFPNLILEPKFSKLNLKTDNFYIDVVEQYQTIIRNNCIIKNSIYGEVIYKDNREIKIEAKLPIMVNILKSNHKITVDKDKNDNNIKIYYKNGNRTLLSYNINNINEPLIYFEKTNHVYKFKTQNWIKFKSIRIRIPVFKTTYNAQIDVKQGTAILNEKENYIEWKMTNIVLFEESIYISPQTLYNISDNRNIKIDFVIENYKNSLIKIYKSEVIFNQEARIWVKYFTQAAYYEIRF